MSKDMAIGWTGPGRMGAPMVEKIIKAGYQVKIWNRTKSKADALVSAGASLVDAPSDLANVDVLFTMVSTGKDLRQVYFGDVGVMSGDDTPKILVECSSISAPESAEFRQTALDSGAGVPRHAFLEFINNSVMGSNFSQYKTPALVNLDWTTTFTPPLLRKDLDLGLQAARELGVSMPVTAATREALQSHFGSSSLKDDPEGYLAADFSALIETVALQAGIKLVSENKDVKTGLEV